MLPRRALGPILVGLLASATTRAHGAGDDPNARAAPAGATPVSEGRATTSLTKGPRLLSAPRAEYPAGESGAAKVVLAITIGADGRVRAVEVLHSGGDPFDRAALNAAQRLAFTPAEVNGRPSAIKIAFTYEFAPPRLPSPPGPGAAPAVPTPPPASDDVVAHGVRRRRDETDVTVAAEQASKVVGTQGDPIKVLENLPGLARPSFGSGQIIVWGAAPTETKIYVDGVEIPALFHGSALRSTVNGDLVREVTLTPGAYGADYGRAIGGMVRVETKDLPAAGVHGYAGLDSLDGSAMVTASLGDRVRIGIAARYGWLNSLLQAVDAPNVDEFYAVPRYTDYQAKLQLRLRDHESVDAVFLASNDDLVETIPDADPAHARSETTATSYQRFYLRYRRETDEGAQIEVVPWIGHETSNLEASFGENPATLDASTWRWGLRASHRSRVSGARPPTPISVAARQGSPISVAARQGSPIALTWGVELDGSSANVFRNGSLLIPPREGDVAVFGEPPGNATNVDSWTAGVIDVAPYVIADLALGPLAVSAGLRVDGFVLQTSRQTPRIEDTPPIGYQSLRAEPEPRISARLTLTPHLSLLAAAGVYAQPPDPADLSAVFGNPTLGPATADHASLGESLRITPTLSLDVIGFYKWMSGLAVRDPSPTPKLAAALLPEGAGRAYGLQFLLRQQPWHGLFGWVAYTISRSEREDTPGARWRLFDYDQPHALTIVASQELGAWSFGARFRYASGLPRTPVVGAFYDTKDDVYQPIFGPQNSIRLPDFWQLDLRVDRTILVGERARVLVYVEGLNVTDHANGEEYIYNVDYTRRGTVTGLPVIAVLGVRAEL